MIVVVTCLFEASSPLISTKTSTCQSHVPQSELAAKNMSVHEIIINSNKDSPICSDCNVENGIEIY